MTSMCMCLLYNSEIYGRPLTMQITHTLHTHILLPILNKVPIVQLIPTR